MSSPLVLTPQQFESGWRACRQLSVERASNGELAALADEYGTEAALLRADLAAGDFTQLDEATIRSALVYYEHELEEVARQAERRLRARRAGADGGASIDIYRARFDAMRHADIVEGIQTLGIPLQKRGREWWACCPFHEDRTPSFAVNHDKGVWHCHGCQKGGDLVRFAMERMHLNAVEALRFLEEIIDVPGVAT